MDEEEDGATENFVNTIQLNVRRRDRYPFYEVAKWSIQSIEKSKH